MGESSGYMITVNGRSYLLECGAPLFPSLGYKGVSEIKGIFSTHSHEDHKRWFTDVVLFKFYNPLSKQKVNIISSESVLEEFAKNSKGALGRSLTNDAKRVIDIPYGEMVDEIIIGPKSKYAIKLKNDEAGCQRYTIEDLDGNIIGPEKAKIIINPKANRPRILYRDDNSGEWVEPECFYPFSSRDFYTEDQNLFYDDKAGLAVEAIKAPVWHGVPSVAFKFMTEGNSLIFAGDTVYRPSLWKELCQEHRPQRFDSISKEKFEKSSIIYGDINDFIERAWSTQRYESAMSAYEGSIIIHDVARTNSITHTDYCDIADAPIKDLLFTHNPDNLTAFRPILISGQRLIISDSKIYESVKGDMYLLDGDVYVHHFSCDLVGYRSDSGSYKVIEKDGLLGITEASNPEQGIMRVNLFQNIGGEYFPLLKDSARYYRSRPDNMMEEVTVRQDSSTGKIIENLRVPVKK